MKSPDRYFAAGGANLRYRDEGRGPPVVLVHGWSLDLDMWEPQVSGLIPPYRIVRWDRRGLRSFRRRARVASDVSDIRALCQHLGIKRAALVGMSQGARVICALAAATPAMVSCLIFDGAPDLTSHPGVTAHDVPIERYRSLLRGRDPEAISQRMAEPSHVPASLPRPERKRRPAGHDCPLPGK